MIQADNTKTEEAEIQTVAKPDDTEPDDVNNENTTKIRSTLPAVPPPASENNQELSTKGTLRMKTYTLKKKAVTKHRSFKCSECDVVKKSIRELNSHHEECHNPQICGICGKLFKLASSLARHMYEHN